MLRARRSLINSSPLLLKAGDGLEGVLGVRCLPADGQITLAVYDLRHALAKDRVILHDKYLPASGGARVFKWGKLWFHSALSFQPAISQFCSDATPAPAGSRCVSYALGQRFPGTFPVRDNPHCLSCKGQA